MPSLWKDNICFRLYGVCVVAGDDTVSVNEIICSSVQEIKPQCPGPPSPSLSFNRFQDEREEVAVVRTLSRSEYRKAGGIPGERLGEQKASRLDEGHTSTQVN